MATSCDQVTARMMELLYGELPESERPSIEAHVSGCGRCRDELAGFQKTRLLARGMLDEPAPARARAAVLSAAARARASVRPSAAPTRPRSLWLRIRSRWTLPTLVTVGAVAVFLVGSRLFLDPQRSYERGHLGLLPKGADEPRPAPAPALEASPDEPEGAATPALQTAPSEPSEPRAERMFKKAGKQRDLGSIGNGGGTARSDGINGASPARRQWSAPPPPRVKGEPTAEAQEPAPLGDKAGARPTLPNAAAPTPGRAEAAFDDALIEGEAADAVSSAGGESKKTSPPAQTPVQRADRLFAEQRWAEAAMAYRDLLRNDPHNADAPRWRQRLVTATRR